MNTTIKPRSVAHGSTSPASGSSQVLTLVLAWAAVALPLGWGVAETLRKTLALFQ
jgi:hypothetical protein